MIANRASLVKQRRRFGAQHTTLAAAIGEGAVRPGTEVPEDAIAYHLGVSRTVVRCAIGILESEHLLARKKNRGTLAAQPGGGEAKALFEPRRKLERVIGDEKSKTVPSDNFHIVLAELGGNAVMV